MISYYVLCVNEMIMFMRIDKDTSERLNLLRFPLIVGVVFIHAYGTDVSFSNESIGVAQCSWFSNFIRELVSQGFARIAVPLFFLMSGYLFFLEFQWSQDEYKKKLLSRVNTLLIPFIFWNFFMLLLLYVAQSLPATQNYFSGKNAPISSFGLYDYFNTLLGIDRSPISYQFWFIRDLMIMVLLVPIVQLIFKTIPAIFLGIISVLWFFQLWPIYIPSSEAFLFFYIGAFLAVSKQSLFKMDKYGSVILFLYSIILLADALTKCNALNGYIHRIGILLGIASALYATKFVLNNGTLRSFFLWSASCSFFVYAVHEPLLTIFKKIAYKLLTPSTDIIVLVLYFSIPVFVITISILAYMGLKSLTPKFLSIVSGGR